MNNQEYHAHPALGSSSIREILKSPYHFRESLDKRSSYKTPALIQGSAIHTAVLEPELFKKEFIVAPEFNGTGSRAKKEEFTLLNAGKTIITIDQFNTAQRCKEAIDKNNLTKHLLSKSNGVAENSFFSKLSDIDVKCRPDFLRNDNIVIDLKSTTDASPNDFKKSVISFGYHIQAAFYLDVLISLGKVKDNGLFIIIAIEKSDPSPEKIGVYSISQNAIELGRIKYKQALEIYKKCSESNYWPGYAQKVIDIDLPAWAYNENNLEILEEV